MKESIAGIIAGNMGSCEFSVDEISGEVEKEGVSNCNHEETINPLGRVYCTGCRNLVPVNIEHREEMGD